MVLRSSAIPCCCVSQLMCSSYLWLVVVLHRHSDDIDPNDEGDEEVQIVAGAEGVDVLPCWGIVSVVRPALGFCKKRRKKGNIMNTGLAAWLAAITMWPTGQVLHTPCCRAKPVTELVQASHV